MSPGPISRSPDLLRLRNEGYDIEILNGHLLVKDVPYVDSARTVRRGILVTTLTLSADVTAPPDTHVALFVGDHPCNATGTIIEAIRHQTSQTHIGPGLTANHSFSSKPPSGKYADYYEKVTTYVNILQGPAQALQPSVDAKTFRPVPADGPESVFHYVDTATSRAGTNVASAKLEGKIVAIVGLGGTGSYVLDLVAKTPVAEIHLYDGDYFLQHNAFRAPGAPSIEQLAQRRNKAERFAELYSRMHKGVVPHPQYVSEANVHELFAADVVFLCMDGGDAKRTVVERLRAQGTAFIDTGMGIQLVDGHLVGVVRVTAARKGKLDHIESRIALAGGPPDEYATNIQIADLNALNAALAVLKWKKWCGFYADLEKEYHCLYTVDGNHLTNAEQS
jgi:hypothetical protein